MDWTGTRMRTSEGVGELTLTPEIAGPYRDGQAGVTDFVTRYAHASITRMKLTRVVVLSPGGQVLGEILPPTKKAPF